MDAFSVEDVRAGAPDGHGVEVVAVYALYDPYYAVYRTVERVSIWFADDPRLERDQRAKMAPIAPVRGEINGLVDGWRSSDKQRFQSAALRFDRRVADALIVALEGDPGSALAILGAIRTDVLAERTSRARFLYLIVAAATAVMMALVAAALIGPVGLGVFNSYATDACVAISAGALGSFFSIARGMRSRSIHTDLQMSDNLSDAVLRILIGSIAALVLQALLDAGLFGLQLGNARLGPPIVNGEVQGFTPPLVLLVACFIAGFSERLVPDLLDSACFTKGEQPATPAAAPITDAKAAAPEDAAATEATEAIPAPEEPSPEEEVDGCDVDAAAADVPVTPDDRLPAASGGVAAR